MDGDGHGELRLVVALEDVASWVAHELGLLNGGHEVVVLLLDVIHAAHAPKYTLGGVNVAAIDEGVGVSGRKSVATTMVAASIAASARLTCQPDPPLIWAAP